MKHLFTLLCWGVLALGLILACTKRPAPAGQALHVDRLAPTKLAEAPPLEDIDIPQTVLVYFPLNSAEIRDPGALDALGKILRASGALLATVEGHACPLGAEPYNERLGLQRAQAVAKHMEDYGVPSWRVKTESLGERRPVTLDQKEYWRNRRAEITFERKIP
jgi:outer membrane protein OmpA-like peptidoglycan-associated protein